MEGLCLIAQILNGTSFDANVINANIWNRQGIWLINNQRELEEHDIAKI